MPAMQILTVCVCVCVKIANERTKTSITCSRRSESSCCWKIIFRADVDTPVIDTICFIIFLLFGSSSNCNISLHDFIFSGLGGRVFNTKVSIHWY